MAGCAVCQRPLTLDLGPGGDSDTEQLSVGNSSLQAAQIVPDDVQLECGCHFHWQCILDAYQLTECPHCKSNISVIGSTGDLQVLCNLDNEGGLQEGLDILPLLTEESYLKAYPEERRCRAFLEFCREGDIEAIVDLIQDEEDADDADKEGSSLAKKDILRYQDTLGPMYSGLHIAVINQEVEVAWLLLFLASNLDLELFPPRVLQTARNMRIERVDASGAIDIRALMDVDGRTARYYASAHHGDIWTGCPLHI